MSRIRTSAKALIKKNNKILLVQHEDKQGLWHTLPGGGQRKGETLAEAVVRECLEEVNARIEVGALLFVREYIGDNHEFAEFHHGLHQIEFIFKCSLLEEYAPATGHKPDTRQVGVSWVDISKLAEKRLYPKIFRTLIPNMDKLTLPRYLGDVN